MKVRSKEVAERIYRTIVRECMESGELMASEKDIIKIIGEEIDKELLGVEMKGSNTVSMKKDNVRVDISVMSEEARTLLDKLCEEYEKLHGKKSIHKKISAYGVLYWACRWSGLIMAKPQYSEICQDKEGDKA